MGQETTASELDLALVNALQLRPRAPWSELAPLLGVTASTLARRWERLCGAGLAWVYAVPGREFTRSRCTAFVLLRCAPGARSRLIAELSASTEAATIEVTAPGSADLFLDVLAPDLASLGRFVTETLDGLPGITSVRCLFATSLYVEGAAGGCVPWTPPSSPRWATPPRGRPIRSVCSTSTPSTGPCSTHWSVTAAWPWPNSPTAPTPAPPPSAAGCAA
ncbi:Lrp/AsnC family transcriptional regulator [Streptomyces rectiviolaceus]|uniref:Lrp/AsnC family transcriptional regulator n=1 Tax=Streptomyces rectiviolaceus TaxID=332591 RepID=UPI0036319E38